MKTVLRPRTSAIAPDISNVHPHVKLESISKGTSGATQQFLPINCSWPRSYVSLYSLDYSFGLILP